MSAILFIQSVVLYAWPLWASNIALNLLFFAKKYDRQLDGGRLFSDGRPILGSSVTWGGLALSLVMALAMHLALPGHELVFWKVASGFIGHALASFIKRRCGIAQGRYIPLLNHGDYIVAFAGISAAFGAFDGPLALAAYAVTILGTPLVTYWAYRFGMRSRPL